MDSRSYELTSKTLNKIGFMNNERSTSLKELEDLFAKTFLTDYRTILVGGYDEPFYLAPLGESLAEIRFTKDYVRSAHHEIAHWCVAGLERRQQDDFGYWYAPDGRSAEQQSLFFAHEVLPQAYEWAFSLAAKLDFEVSADNLKGRVDGVDNFKSKVLDKLLHLWQSQKFPQRAMRWIDALKVHYNSQDIFEQNLKELLAYSCKTSLLSS